MRMGSSTVVLSVPRPFDLRAAVHSYGYYELPPCRWDDGSGTLFRAERGADGRAYLLAVSEAGTSAPGYVELRVSITGRRRGRSTTAGLIAAVRKTLRLAEDLRPFYALCRGQAALRVLPRLGVGRLMRGSSLFEDLVKAISWTNTEWSQAVRMIGRIGELGDPCPGAVGLRAFPSPAQVCEAGLRFLRDEARLGYRAAYVFELAERTCSGDLDLEAFEARAATMSAEQAARQLRQIKGVGKASAAYVLVMLGHYEHLILDSWTRACAARLFFGGRDAKDAEIEALFEKFGRWRALVAWFVLALSHDGFARMLKREGRRPGKSVAPR
jgi:3-methyladenine DNA glycosylase/8-oxoguanine DNA glycosylase